LAVGHFEDLEIDDNNTTNMNIEKTGGCEQDSCASQQTSVTICKKKTPKEFHKVRRFYSSDDGVLTSEGGFCEDE